MATRPAKRKQVEFAPIDQTVWSELLSTRGWCSAMAISARTDIWVRDVERLLEAWADNWLIERWGGGDPTLYRMGRGLNAAIYSRHLLG